MAALTENQTNQRDHDGNLMRLRFHEIPAAGLEFSWNQTTGELNEVLSDLLGAAPVYEANLKLATIENTVQLRGQLAGQIQHQCSRCAEDFMTPFKKNFVTAYYNSAEKMDGLSEAIDDLEGSFDVEFIEGSEISLADVVHEQVALEIPFKPLCSESCLGLCTKCGANLNLSPCACDKKVASFDKISPFEALKSLKN